MGREGRKKGVCSVQQVEAQERIIDGTAEDEADDERLREMEKEKIYIGMLREVIPKGDSEEGKKKKKREEKRK